ncbi:MAG TPA: hypothetical protein VFD01_05145 [Candidatus Dormibacteraeota bacterium]|nr:hypothetical protein [Candidatus Dormibacteraeota bacterium]
MADIAGRGGVLVDMGVRILRACQHAQAELLKLSTRSALIVATESGHGVPISQPSLISEAALRMVDQTAGPPT